MPKVSSVWFLSAGGGFQQVSKFPKCQIVLKVCVVFPDFEPLVGPTTNNKETAAAGQAKGQK